MQHREDIHKRQQSRRKQKTQKEQQTRSIRKKHTRDNSHEGSRRQRKQQAQKTQNTRRAGWTASTSRCLGCTGRPGAVTWWEDSGWCRHIPGYGHTASRLAPRHHLDIWAPYHQQNSRFKCKSMPLLLCKTSNHSIRQTYLSLMNKRALRTEITF